MPLGTGAEGEAIRDLQLRLAAAGQTVIDRPGYFGDGTEQAVRAFQSARGLRADGVCGHHTWAALVEAGHRLGDRTLYLAQPMLRGDDVADLQRRLGSLGFDAGRVDAFFGPDTERALLEFQRNAGLVGDAIFGLATLVALTRVAHRGPPAEPVAGVRERETLRHGPRTLDGRKVVVGETGGLDALVRATGRMVTGAGATVVVVQHPDGSQHASQANAMGADVYLGVALATEGHGCTVSYYAGHGWESPGGRRLAELVRQAVTGALRVTPACVRGMSVPVLRETRMPAVVCELAPPPAVVEHSAELARALGLALAAWVAAADD